MDEEFSTYLEVFNFAFSLCFMLEMALKVGLYRVIFIEYMRRFQVRQRFHVTTS